MPATLPPAIVAVAAAPVPPPSIRVILRRPLTGSPICRHARRYTPCEMASTLTPEQIEVYAATLRVRSAETARRRRERREQAWTVARQAAQVLRSQFGVTSVWVFGSLAEGDHFTEQSDIDMAATGFTPAVHVEALGRLLRLSADFEFDLVDLDHCPHGLRPACRARRRPGPEAALRPECASATRRTGRSRGRRSPRWPQPRSPGQHLR